MSTCGVIAGALWAVVAGLLLAAWTVALVWSDHWRVAGMLAATGCATSALAATLHIKTYACRVSRLIRVANGLEVGDVSGRCTVRPLR